MSSAYKRDYIRLGTPSTRVIDRPYNYIRRRAHSHMVESFSEIQLCHNRALRTR